VRHSATDRSHGRYERRVELAQLGRVLDDSAQRRRAQDTYDRNQLELLGGLQPAESEHEARDLLRHHRERMVADSKFTILKPQQQRRPIAGSDATRLRLTPVRRTRIGQAAFLPRGATSPPAHREGR
jgi:hypothetical protein